MTPTFRFEVLSLLPLLLVAVVSQTTRNDRRCVDQPSYYHYTCTQLVNYCPYQQAVGVRLNCPVTCGLCNTGPEPETVLRPPQPAPRINQPPPQIEDRSVTDAEAVRNIQGCCQIQGISTGCLGLCRYDTSRQEIIQAAVTKKCSINDAKVWVQCAANGNNNQQCCRNHNVNAECNAFCVGGFVTSFTTVLRCLNNDLEHILTCHRENLRKN